MLLVLLVLDIIKITHDAEQVRWRGCNWASFCSRTSKKDSSEMPNSQAMIITNSRPAGQPAETLLVARSALTDAHGDKPVGGRSSPPSTHVRGSAFSVGHPRVRTVPATISRPPG
jgi:hypothetical protein